MQSPDRVPACDNAVPVLELDQHVILFSPGDHAAALVLPLSDRVLSLAGSPVPNVVKWLSVQIRSSLPILILAAAFPR